MRRADGRAVVLKMNLIISLAAEHITAESKDGNKQVEVKMDELRQELLAGLQTQVRQEYGIELVDVRLRRFNHPPQVRALRRQFPCRAPPRAPRSPRPRRSRQRQPPSGSPVRPTPRFPSPTRRATR